MTDLERDVEKYFKKRVEEAGGRALKFVSPGLVGVPDRLVLWPGGVAQFVELKKPKGAKRSAQERRVAELRALGFWADFADTKEKVDNYIAREGWRRG